MLLREVRVWFGGVGLLFFCKDCQPMEYDPVSNKEAIKESINQKVIFNKKPDGF